MQERDDSVSESASRKQRAETKETKSASTETKARKVAAVAAEVEDAGERLGYATQQVRAEAGALVDTLGSAVQEVREYVGQQMRERPYVSLGVAAGVGYILGGGLTLRVGRALFGLGGRLAASYVLREVMRPAMEE